MMLSTKEILKFLTLMNKLNLIVLLVFFALGLSAQNIDKIVGVVGDQIILKSDIDIQVQQMAAQDESAASPETNCAVLDEMLLQKMMITHAELDSLVVSEDEVEGELDQRIRYFVNLFGGDQSKLEAYYSKSIVEIKEEFRAQIEEQLLARKMQQDVIGNVKVTPSEIKEFYESIPRDSLPFYNAEVELAQIVIKAKPSEEQKKKAEEDLAALKKRIDEGEDFAVLAAVYSADKTSAENGGELGFISRNELVNEFASAAFRLANNEVSDIVETEYGLHIIQMIERRGEKANMRHILLKPEITSYDLETAKAKLNDVRKLILTDSIEFNTAVNKYSEDVSTKNQGGSIVNPNTGAATFEMDQLDLTLFSIIDTMKVNQVSKPASFIDRDGSLGYRLIRLKKSTDAHRANLTDDYEKIKSVAESFKQQEAINEWMAKKAPETYVFIDEDFKQCGNAQKWFK